MYENVPLLSSPIALAQTQTLHDAHSPAGQPTILECARVDVCPSYVGKRGTYCHLRPVLARTVSLCRPSALGFSRKALEGYCPAGHDWTCTMKLGGGTWLVTLLVVVACINIVVYAGTMILC
jgi:hypothetical protein